jgi:hypothetical protein
VLPVAFYLGRAYHHPFQEMPPKTKTGGAKKPRKAAAVAPPTLVSVGAGMTAGLELWHQPSGAFFLVDKTPDGRFATDVATWNAAAGIN